MRRDFLGRTNCRNFHCQVDADRTPRDAADAADAAGRAELIVPRRKLVCHPLPISAFHTIPRGASVHVAEGDIEARVPVAFAINVVASQIRHLGHGRAETRRTHHRAIRTRQASIGDFLPSRMAKIVHQQITNVGRIKLFGNLINGLPHSESEVYFDGRSFEYKSSSCSRVDKSRFDKT